MKRMLFVVAVVALAFTFVACDGDSGGDGGTVVDITLQEWAVVPSQSSAPAGEITFAISNDGQEVHEFVIIKTDLSVLDLPTEADGSVSESGEGMDVIDEVEDIPSGDSTELTVTLEAGSYGLICNIVEEMEGGMAMEHDSSHFQMGMRTAFEVE